MLAGRSQELRYYDHRWLTKLLGGVRWLQVAAWLWSVLLLAPCLWREQGDMPLVLTAGVVIAACVAASLGVWRLSSPEPSGADDMWQRRVARRVLPAGLASLAALIAAALAAALGLVTLSHQLGLLVAIIIIIFPSLAVGGGAHLAYLARLVERGRRSDLVRPVRMARNTSLGLGAIIGVAVASLFRVPPVWCLCLAGAAAAAAAAKPVRPRRYLLVTLVASGIAAAGLSFILASDWPSEVGGLLVFAGLLTWVWAIATCIAWHSMLSELAVWIDLESQASVVVWKRAEDACCAASGIAKEGLPHGG